MTQALFTGRTAVVHPDQTADAVVTGALREAGVHPGQAARAVVRTHRTGLDVAGPLHPAEAAQLGTVGASRRADFTAGRHCARTALAIAGGPADTPLLTGDNRAVRWPAGWIGSITHTRGLAAATVAPAGLVAGDGIASLGMDAEPDVPLPGSVLERITDAAERDHLDELARHRGDIAWDTMLFCAKESVFKAWWPVTSRWLGFTDARIEFDPDHDRFRADLVPVLGDGPTGPLRTLTGRMDVVDGVLIAAAVLVDTGGRR